MRRIDADAVRDDFANTVYLECANDKDNSRANRIIGAFDDLPTIDAEPVRHGRWIDCDYKKLEHGFVETYPNAGKCCSNCRTGFKKEIIEGYIFCPNCGAKMDEM